MIKIGIDGAGSAEAGELIRLLINHPDVELVQVCQPELSGRDISDVHHGLVGEKKLAFVKKLDYDAIDIAFCTASASDLSLERADEFIASKTDPESGYVIFLSPDDAMLEASAPFFLQCHDETTEGDAAAESDDWTDTIVYGVPELNRKPLVRGSRKVVVPTAVESITAVTLYPLRKSGRFPERIDLNVKGARDIMEGYRKNKTAIERRISSMLTSISGKNVDARLFLKDDECTRRGVSLSVDMPLTVTIDEIRSYVIDVYDDHHLAHLSGKELSYDEVEGTDNCLIEISQLGAGVFRINSVADARLRGGAGEAVHIMNLFAGLFEKTGLHLKASNF